MKAARYVFERDGYSHSRIGDISEQAKVGYGTFYHYFRSKEDIFLEVAVAQERYLAKAISSHSLAVFGESPSVGIRSATRSYLQAYKRDAKLMRVIEEVSRSNPAVDAARRAVRSQSVTQGKAGLEEWLRRRMVDSRINPSIAIEALSGMNSRFAEAWLTQGHGEYDFDDVTDQLSLLWANAIGLKDGSRQDGVWTPKRRATRAAQPNC